MPKEPAKIYNPKEVEDRLYKVWEQNGYFTAHIDKNKKPYTIVMPPPNITGRLHMGHALNNTMQDIIIRFKRMQGYSALWLPGTDHASIATEAKIVKSMRAEGVTKEDIGRDGFLERAWQWNDEYGGIILNQLKKLGTSCDWSRLRFTLDEGCNEAVYYVFKKLYDEGIIYKGERIINWCINCKTSISDAEVQHIENEGHFWYIKYPLSDGSGFLQIATTRPETLLGDTAVAVHPEDDRYKNLVDKTVILPLLNKEIPIIADTYVDMEFGTGVVKITPSHDPNDYEVGMRHNLPMINVLTEDGHVNENGGDFTGMERFAARKAIVSQLESDGLLIKVEKIKNNVGTCSRCKTVVEPRVSKQWFMHMEDLAKPAIESVKNGDTKIIPERLEKVYFNWLDNIRDWCISRQLWWGHRIPAFYCDKCGEITVETTKPVACVHCGGASLTQDPDTLDTWFSSALWPFSTLGWPQKTEDLEYFYPTNTLITGYDIIFFWAIRMMFSGLKFTDKAPFNTMLFNGLVRDEQGRKMSKSLDNGIDPLIEMDKFGADALRFSLISGNTPGNDMRYIEEKTESARNFANKVWNATRFILMNLDENDTKVALPKVLAVEDKWLLTKYNNLVTEVTNNLDKFEIGQAAQKLYDFLWDIVCDWYIELVKVRLNTKGETAFNAKSVLVYVFSNTLKLLHPIMPFVTEEIWLSLPHSGDSIMISDWPKGDISLNFAEEEQSFEMIVTAIRAIRNRRAEMNVPPSKKAAVYIATKYKDTFVGAEEFLKKLAHASSVEVGDSFEIPNAVSVVTTNAVVYIPMGELLDFEAEKLRLNKQLQQINKELEFINSKLNNKAFVDKAPEKVVQQNKESAEQLQLTVNKINEQLKGL